MDTYTAAIALCRLYNVCQALADLRLHYTLPDAFTTRRLATMPPPLSLTHREALTLLGNVIYDARRAGSANTAHLDCMEALSLLSLATAPPHPTPHHP